MPKKILFLIFKVLLVLSVIFYLIYEKKLTYNSLYFVFDNYKTFFFSIFFMFCISVPICSYRWSLILKDFKINYKKLYDLFKITMIAQFFSIFMPGGATSDIVKGFYLHSKQNSKLKIYLSIFLDRLFGLFAIIILSIIFFLIELYFLSTYNFFNFILVIFMFLILIIFCLIFLFRKIILNYIKKLKIDAKKTKRISLFFDAISELKKNTFYKTFLLSIFNQLIILIIFMIIIMSFNNLSILKAIYLSIPTLFSQIITMVPVSPMGIGIGHLSLEKFYDILGHTNGAEIFNIYLLCRILLGLIGSLFYFLYPSSIENNKI